MRTDVGLPFVLAAMLFLHIVDDFYLQGLLASLKQKSWWKTNYPEDMYKLDYIAALFIHAASWAFMVQLPIAYLYYFKPPFEFYAAMAANIAIHAFIDDQKANKRTICLATDQMLHAAQIISTFALLIFAALKRAGI